MTEKYFNNINNNMYWNNFYKNINFKDTDWYFNIQNLNTTKFNIKNYSKENEILYIGCGTSSLIKYFFENSFKKVIFIDFSECLIEHLEKLYLINENESHNNKFKENTNEWDCN